MLLSITINVQQTFLLSHNYEEADTLIILHAVDVAANDPFKELTIWSPDTDVFLLLIYYLLSTKFMQQNIVSKGSDFTAKFNGKSKLTTWKCFIESDEQILKAFSLLGETNKTSIEEIQTDIELFVMNLYCPKRPASFKIS